MFGKGAFNQELISYSDCSQKVFHDGKFVGIITGDNGTFNGTVETDNL